MRRERKTSSEAEVLQRLTVLMTGPSLEVTLRYYFRASMQTVAAQVQQPPVKRKSTWERNVPAAILDLGV